MRRDALTKKSTKIGQTSRHHHSGAWAMRAPASKKVWYPNIHTIKVKIDGVSKKIKVTTKSLRFLKNNGATITRAQAKALGII